MYVLPDLTNEHDPYSIETNAKEMRSTVIYVNSKCKCYTLACFV